MFDLSLTAKISLTLILSVGLIYILLLMIREKIKIEIGLLWIISFLAAIIIIIFDKILKFLTEAIGGVLPSSGLSLLAFAFIFLLLIVFSSNISFLFDKVKNLSQYISYLEKRIRDLENKTDTKTKKK